MLITTKKGKAGATQIQVSSNTEFMNPLRLPDFQTRYGTGRKGKASGSTIHSWGAPLNQAARYNYSPEDFLQTGHILTNSVTLSGGTEKNQIYFSTAAVNSKGLIPNNKYNRYNFTFRNTSNLLNDRLTLDVSGSYIIQKDRNMINQGVYSNPLVSAYLFPRGDDFSLVKAFERWNPARKIYEQFWPQGEGGDLRMQNPYWIAYRNPRENSRKRYMFTGGITYKITDWMNVAGRIRVDNTNSLYTEKLYATSNPTLLENSKKGKYTETRGEERQTYGDVMLNLSKTFKEKFSLDAHIGASIKDNRFDELSVYGPIAGAPNIFNVVNLDKSQKKTPKTGWHEQTQSFFYSLELGWKSQLFVTTTGRNDWASQLANSPQKSFFYPSVGVSWLPSSTFNFPEKFNYLKIRASYGLSGNDYLADSSNNIVRFPYLTTVNMNKALYVWFSPNFVKQTGHEIKTVGNPLATWEESTKLNVGLELGLFDALTLNVDVYKENRTGIFMQRRSLPSTMGLSGVTPYGNLGEVENRGVDVSLEYNKAFNKDLLVSVRGTFTYAHNEVKARDEAKYLPNKYNSVLGKPVNSVYGLVADGLFASQEEIDNSPRQTFMPDYLPGDIKYRDLNGDGVIDANDRTSLGYPTVPEILYGFGASVNYKRWDFSFFFQGTARVSLRMYDMHPFRDNQYSGFNMTQYVADDHWSEADPNPNAAYPRLDYRYNANNTQTSSFWIKNGSYLRLKSVELGFTYKSLRAYLAGTNLFIISPFKYWDPEMGSGNGLKYPLQRVVKLGLQYNF